MIYYSKTNQTFFDDSIHDELPEDSVAITADVHTQALDALNNGLLFVVSDNGQSIDIAPSQSHDTYDPETGWVLNQAKASESKKQQLNDAKTAAEASINNAVANVMQPLTRFEAEYKLREAQAQSYADANYQGDIPTQVAAFATPTGLTPKKAAQTILAQAANLRGALEQLGVLRMRKFELTKLKTVDDVNERTNEILAAINQIGSSLGGAA